MISLLLRESDGLLTKALGPPNVTILLRLFLKSAQEVYKRHHEGGDADTSGNSAAMLGLSRTMASVKVSTPPKGKGATGKNPRKTKAAAASESRATADEWETMNSILTSNLHRLLTRFRDDESNLIILTGLLECCDISINPKASKVLLKILTELLKGTSSEALVERLLAIIGGWLKLGSGDLNASLESIVMQVAEEALGKVQEVTATFKAAASVTASPNEVRERPCSFPAAAWLSICPLLSLIDDLLSLCYHMLLLRDRNMQAELEDAVYACASSLMKFNVIWKTMDCRPLLDQVIADEKDAHMASWSFSFREGRSTENQSRYHDISFSHHLAPCAPCGCDRIVTTLWMT
jgi:hypothetical protein